MLVLLGALQFALACGDKSSSQVALGKSDAGLANAEVEAKTSGSAGKAGARSVPVSGAGTGAGAGAAGTTAKAGSRIVDASVSDEDGGHDVGGTGGSAAIASGPSAGAAGSGSGGTSGSQAVAGAAGMPTAGSAAAAQGPTVTLTGQVIEVHTDGSFTPYASAEVCVLDSMPAVCATSDASGKLVIKLPANTRTGLTMNLPGLFPMLTPITTGDTDIDLSGRGEWSNYGAAVVLTEETRSAATAMLKTTLDPSKGQADMIVFGLGSGTVTLDGTPAELKWFSSNGQFTVTDGPAPLGSVLHWFTNIEPGMRTFRAEMNGKPCAFDPMIWPGAEPGTITVPIRAGWWTRLMEVRCN